MGLAPQEPAKSHVRGASSSYVTPRKAPVQEARTPKHGQTPNNPIDLTDDGSSLSSKKRAPGAYPTTPSGAPSSQSAKKRKPAMTPTSTGEKRVRVFRARPPQAFHDVYARALSQRFYVLNRTRAGTNECPEEIVEMTGSTGNIYTIHIAKQPRCNCPHAAKGNQCKHVLYVSSNYTLPPRIKSNTGTGDEAGVERSL